jgi:thiosulfate/3-mercaptopyruvate sulfurtransferase
MKIGIFSFAAVMIVVFAWISAVLAACPAGGCGGGDESWTASAESFMNSDVPLVGVTANKNTETSSLGSGYRSGAFSSGSFKAGESVGEAVDRTADSATAGTSAASTSASISGVYATPGSRANLFPASQILKPLDALSEKEIVLDVSNHRSPGQGHIRGAVNIPAKSFFYENGTARSATELAAMLGEAGISSRDSVMIYSDSFSSGEATAVLWALLCLGQEGVRALDGGLDNWIAASLPMETKENVRSAASYAAGPRLDYVADYDYVSSGQAQMVDARSFQEYGKARIGNATFISPENVMEEGRLKPGTGLNDTFARLNASRAVVVYSDDIYGASVVWFALQLMGFDSRIYTWQDWQAHETEGGPV